MLENLPRLALEDAVTVEQSVVDAIQQQTVSVGTTCHDATQKFSTLVLRAGRTILPRLQVQSCDTPLTQQVFAAGLFDATTSSNLAASFGQTKIRLEVRSASPEQYAGDFNAEKEWHQHMPTPWDVMQLNPAEALTISCQSCGVQIAPSELRNTCGRSFVIKELAKFNQDCSALFPQDSKIVCLPRWPRSSRSLALSPHIPHNINSVPSANTAQPGNGKHNWPQLAYCGETSAWSGTCAKFNPRNLAPLRHLHFSLPGV